MRWKCSRRCICLGSLTQLSLSPGPVSPHDAGRHHGDSPMLGIINNSEYTRSRIETTTLCNCAAGWDVATSHWERCLQANLRKGIEAGECRFSASLALRVSGTKLYLSRVINEKFHLYPRVQWVEIHIARYWIYSFVDSAAMWIGGRRRVAGHIRAFINDIGRYIYSSARETYLKAVSAAASIVAKNSYISRYHMLT